MNEPVLTLQGRTLSGEVTVAAPPSLVLDYVAELQHLERWWPEHWRYRRLSGDGGPGSRYYWIYAAKGAILAGLTRIEVREPGLLAYRTSMVGLPIRMRYEFLPAAGGTTVRAEMQSAGLRFALIAKLVRKEFGAALGRLGSVAHGAACS